MPSAAATKRKSDAGPSARVKGKFKTYLAMPGHGAWCYLRVEGSAEIFGVRGRIPIKGTINGHSFRSSFQPDGKGNHALMVNKIMQQGGGFTPGDTVTLDVEIDTAPRVVELPTLVKKALATSAKAKDFYAALAPSHKKAYVEWVMEAKQEETRRRRASKMIAMLSTGKKMA